MSTEPPIEASVDALLKEAAELVVSLREGADDPRPVALLMAVLHHGLANLAAESKPAGSNTVVKTAESFQNWLA